MEDTEKKVQNASPKRANFYSISHYDNKLSTLKTNLNSVLESAKQKVLQQRQEKSTLYPGHGVVLSIDKSDDVPVKYGCYVYITETPKLHDTTKTTNTCTSQYVICFITDNEDLLNLFRSDLDKYCLEINEHMKRDETAGSQDIPAGAVSLLENWYGNSVGYLLRCIQALQDNIKFLIYSALLDNKLVTSGGTDELQSDIQRFYSACSLSEILNQLKESRVQNQSSDSDSGSIDMLIDVDQAALETQGTLTISITADSVKLDSSSCNKFCEDWSNAFHRPDCQNNPARMKQIIEAFKLKFIQAMNTLKRILREAENDFYALHRSYVFLRDSGNSEILLHYVTLEAATDVKEVLRVLQEFIKEQQS